MTINRAVAALVAGALVLAGCGLKGPLYLPEKSGDVTIRPAPTSSAPATPAEPAAPESTPQPVPPQTEPPGPEQPQSPPLGIGSG